MEYSLGMLLSMNPSELITKVDSVSLASRKFLASYYPDAHVRRAYLKSIGVVFLDDTSYANVGFTVIPNSPDNVHVYIGSNVSIAPNVTCVCDSCANNAIRLNEYAYVANKITKRGNIIIEDECWIGTNATILPGVTIRRFSVIGAGAVVASSTEAYGIYAGVPARKINDVRTWEDGFDRQG